jgi:hypothetical protein
MDELHRNQTFSFFSLSVFSYLSKNKAISYYIYIVLRFLVVFFIYYQMSSSQLVRRIIKTAAAGPPSGPYRQEMIKTSEMYVKLSILVKLFKLVKHCI